MLQSEISQMETEDAVDPVLEPVLLNGNKSGTSLKHLNGNADHPPDRVGLTVAKPETNISSEEHVIYHVDEGYYSIRNAEDLLVSSQYNPTFTPDFILVELPPLLYFPYPAGLVSSSDLSIMVCRSNRAWSEADQNALKTYMKRTRHNPLFLLNGVEMHVVKSTVGNVGEKEPWIKRAMKKKVRI
jgi:hypothetical protein